MCNVKTGNILHSLSIVCLDTQKQKGLKMDIVFDSKLNGWLVVWSPNIRIRREKWGKSVNGTVYSSWDEASAYIDHIWNNY